MKYIELKIQLAADKTEEIEAVLIEHGYDSMQIDDSSVAREILNNPELYKYDYLNEEIKDFAAKETGDIEITLYFTDDEEGQHQLAEAESLISEMPGASYKAELTGDDSEWLYKWQENFKPTKIGKSIVVKPGWEEYTARDGELVIEMDPGMAFGSGLHETTSMCIKGLENAFDGDYGEAFSSGKIKVLDVGTGTGILSIAAALLGADECLGIDIDDEAVRVGSENVVHNGLPDKIKIAKGDLVEGVDFDADILVANLMADLVMKLAPAAYGHLKPGGLFISSGILDIKVEQVAVAVVAAGFDILEILEDGEWRAIIAVRKADK
ncbi:MAG: 50S ribosomal protein L11 methyltransferase [Mogibacterium sp.]|nr:50S ribosomal protein L11 methyltransferase [Mogibacterium sp.]